MPDPTLNTVTEQATVDALVKDIKALSAKVSTEFATKADVDGLTAKLAAFQVAKGAAERRIQKHRIFGTQGAADVVAGTIGKELIRIGYVDKAMAEGGGEKSKAAGFWLERASGLNSTDAGHFSEAIPTTIDPVVSKLVEDWGVARRNVRVLTGIKGTLQIKKRATRVTIAGQARPDGTAPKTNNTYSGVELSTKQASVIATVEEKLIYESPIDVVGETLEDLAEAAAFMEDDVLFTGDASTADLGFTGINTTTAGVGEQTVAAASFGFDQLILAQTHVHTSVIRRKGAKHWMHPYIFATLQTKKGTTNHYIFDPSTNSFKVSGYDIEFANAMDATLVATKVPHIFGDMQRAITMGLGRDMEFKILTELYAAENSLGFRLTYDVGYTYVQPTTIARTVLT